jgi:hypothetical protein
MSEKQVSNNVIQFPGKKKDGEVKPTPPGQSGHPTKPAAQKAGMRKATTVTAIVSMALLAGAINHFTFITANDSGSLSAASVSEGSRSIASVGPVGITRDPQWERELSERLASNQVRDVASLGIGHAATSEEKLRWGTLEEKYTIVYNSEIHNIQTIELQDTASTPSYVLDRSKFLKDYGVLLQNDFQSAVLKSVEVSREKTIESYTLMGKDKSPTGEARFELDNFNRLLSLKVQPGQI